MTAVHSLESFMGCSERKKGGGREETIEPGVAVTAHCDKSRHQVCDAGHKVETDQVNHVWWNRRPRELPRCRIGDDSPGRKRHYQNVPEPGTVDQKEHWQQPKTESKKAGPAHSGRLKE